MSQIFSKMGHKRIAAYALSKESFEALRYDEIEHARETREQSLNLSRDVQDIFGEAWSSWEMGEIHRVAGDLITARVWYDQARVLFEKFQDSNGFTYYHRGLGDIALANGEYNEAQQQFLQSLEHALKNGFKWGAAYALAGLARVAVCLGQYEAARSYFSEGLQNAITTGDRGLALVVLAGYAGLFAVIGEAERAVELCTLVAEQFAAWKETKKQAAAILSEVKGLALESVAAAQKRGRNTNVWEVTELLLQEALELERNKT
jgi:tetratricopeptide (TPR) repeat protein